MPRKSSLPLLLLFTFLLAFWPLALAASGCKPSPAMEPRGSMVSIDQRVAIAFASAKVALVTLDAAEVAYLEAGTQLKKFHGENDPALIASAKRIAALQTARARLEVVRQNLAGEVKPDLKQVLAWLELALADARAAGVSIPKDVAPALAALKEVLP